MTDSNKATDNSPANPGLKYDRQIRIWGEHGQAALEHASVCLINASATGTETLKNLVLPGIGSFTIIDGENVTETDYTNNFFLSSANPDKCRNRALVAVEAMHELNNAVEGSYIPQNVDTFIDNEDTAYSFFKKFSIVVVSQMGMGHSVLTHISNGCYKANVPLIIVRAYGLLGYLRVQARELCVFDSKEEDIAPDLRLHNPFHQLKDYVTSIDLNNIIGRTAVSRVPFIVILILAVLQFRHSHQGRLPNTRAEKEELSQIVKSLKPTNCPDVAENFDEALKRSNQRLCWKGIDEIPSSLQKVLSDEKSDPQSEAGFTVVQSEVHSDKSCFPEVIRFSKRPSRVGMAAKECIEPVPGATIAEDVDVRRESEFTGHNIGFWVLAAAVRRFVAENGQLPLRGSLPDMASDTESYVMLQKIYVSKAVEDAKQVLSVARKLVGQYGIEDDLDEKYVRRFCQNIHGIRIFRTRSLTEEMKQPNEGGFLNAVDMDGGMDASATHCASPFYPVLRGIDKFYREHGRDAGRDVAMRKADVGLVHGYVGGVKEELGVNGSSGLWIDQTEEVVRYANTELYNVAAFMGGIAAQEITKIVTGQFVPIDNTLIVNLALQTSVTFQA